MITTQLRLLAEQFAEGVDVIPALHDCLIECGYPNAARYCFAGESPIHKHSIKICAPGRNDCASVEHILKDEEEKLRAWDQLALSFLNQIDGVFS